MVEIDLFHWNEQDFVWWWIITADCKLDKLYKTDTATTIKTNVFSRIGIPEIIRSDNDPQHSIYIIWIQENLRSIKNVRTLSSFMHAIKKNILLHLQN